MTEERLEEVEELLADATGERSILMARNGELMAGIREREGARLRGERGPSRLELDLSAEYGENNRRIRVLDDGIRLLRSELAELKREVNAEDIAAMRPDELAAYEQVVEAVNRLAMVQRQIVDLGGLPHRSVNLGITTW